MVGKSAVIWWESLCESDSPYNAFWDEDLTLNTDNPDFTDCFQNTVLTWLPAMWLFLGSCLFTLVLRSQKSKHLPQRGYNRLGQLQLTGLGLLISTEILALMTSYQNSLSETPAHLCSSFIRIVAYATALIFGITCSQYGVHNTGVLFFFWLFSFVTSTITLRSRYMRGMLNGDFSRTNSLFLLQFSSIAFEFFTNFFADGKSLDTSLENEEEEDNSPNGNKLKEQITRYNPEISSSFPCAVFRMWVIKYVWKGYKTKIAWSDLWKLTPENASETIVPDFLRCWNKQLSVEEKRPKSLKPKIASLEVDSSDVDSSDSGFNEIIHKKQNNDIFTKENTKNNDKTKEENKKDEEKKDDLKDGKGLMLGEALFRTLGLQFAAGSVFFYSMECVANFCQPFLLRALISFVESEEPHLWKGCLFAFGIFASISARFLMGHYHGSHNCTFQWRVRTVIVSAIYRKSLKLSAGAKKNRTVGEIVNLMSTDAEKASHFCHILFWIWSSPFVFGMAMYMLWDILGYACLIGVVYMLVVLPFTSITLARQFTSIDKKISEHRDERIKLTNQVLSGIKVLKLYGWEPHFERKVDEIRQREYEGKRFHMLLQCTNDLLWECTPFVVTGLCFSGFLYFNPDLSLDAQTIFVSMALLNIIRTPIHVLPHVINYGSLCFVSLKRLSKFMQLEEIDEQEVTCIPDEDSCIRVKRGRFTWGEKKRSTLSNIDLDVKQGQLIGIVGEVGSGKSSLISAVLGEMIKLHGSVNIVGSRAYVPQQAWIQNMTLRNNVLFDKEYEKARYDSVINACALEHDLKILLNGDLTEIGEKGINLSGGQKQRVSLARAVYQDADVYLFDDPLSAVDSHVGKHIFKEVIGPEGKLKDKTRILVTNQIQYLPYMDKIIVMEDCDLSEQGSYEQLIQRNGRFAQFIKTHSAGKDCSDSTTSDDSDFNDCDSEGNDNLEESCVTDFAVKKRKQKKAIDNIKKCEAESVPDNKKNIVEEEEEMEVGSMSFSTLKWFIDLASWKGTFVLILYVISCRTIEAISNVWLFLWSEEGISMTARNTDNAGAELTTNSTVCYSDDYMDESQRTSNVVFVIGVYIVLGIAQAVCAATDTVLTRLGAHKACNSIHRRLLNNIVRAPMAFFDTTPLGKIVTRFSKDIDSIDNELPGGANHLMHCIVPLCISILLISYNLPLFLAAILPLFLAFVAIKKFATSCQRQLEYMVSNRRAPVFSFFSESLNGATSIRAYGCQERFIRHNEQLCDNLCVALYGSNYVARWMHLNGHLLADLAVLCCALFVVIYRDLLSPSVVGLIIIYSYRISDELMGMLRSSVTLETATVAVQRVREYIGKTTEANWLSEKRDEVTWPEEGKIAFKNYSTKYRPELDLVLNGLNCTIQPSEKVGIVGRTGAGKSSMTLALFRIIEAVEGKIEIDDVDIALLGLHELRCKLAIIPQDPVLFSGSLRFNLDPASEYSNEDIWNALRLSHLKSFVMTLPEMLDYECGEDGKNLSIGQRQLMCLARALLRKTRILVLDEATASVDLDTDALIQKTIRSEFKDCTVITIAHRLNTIIDYDKIMLLDSGRIAEFDSPKQLLNDNTSAFYSMAKDAGLV